MKLSSFATTILVAGMARQAAAESIEVEHVIAEVTE